MQIFFFKKYINSKGAEFSCEDQRIHRVAPKAGNALGDDGIDLSSSAIIHQPEKVGAVSCSGAGGSSVCVYVHQHRIGIFFYQLSVIADLRRKTVVLFFGLRGNTTIGGYPAFRWTLRCHRPWVYHRYVLVAV